MIEVLETGLFSTIQDLGRFDYQSYGVPISGTMDQYSAGMANLILGNHENASLLEITMTGPKLRFFCDTMICISGADISPKLNGTFIGMNKAIFIATGDVLSFGKLKFGCRAYLAVSGGLLTNQIMKSRSQYQGITQQSVIKKGDLLPIEVRTEEPRPNSNSSVRINQQHYSKTNITVFKGPEYKWLNEEQRALLRNTIFSVSNKNSRMAYQLNEVVSNDLKPIITSLVLPGTVQLTPSGQLIILMRDCQTTGGYPRVLQLSRNALNILSQKKMNDRIRFELDAHIIC